MRVTRKIIEINEELCNGCGQCVPSCAEGALEIIGGKARVIAEKYCDGLGACLGDCPTGALKVVERQADEFDEEAVEELLRRKKQEADRPSPSPPAGCPSARLQTFQPATPCQAANRPLQQSGAAGSSLAHWPVQIRLIPPTAPFLQKADLLITADCVPVAFPEFHRRLLQGRTVLMGCPKFDDAEGYIEKFREIFQVAQPNSITMAIMEVPCCATMRSIVAEALKRAGRAIDTREMVISCRGEIIRETKIT